MTSEVDSLPKMMDLIRMIIYNVLLTSWTFAYKSNAFLSQAGSYAGFRNQSNCGFVANYLYLVLGYLGKFLYYKTLTGWP